MATFDPISDAYIKRCVDHACREYAEGGPDIVDASLIVKQLLAENLLSSTPFGALQYGTELADAVGSGRHYPDPDSYEISGQQARAIEDLVWRVSDIINETDIPDPYAT